MKRDRRGRFLPTASVAPPEQQEQEQDQQPPPEETPGAAPTREPRARPGGGGRGGRGRAAAAAAREEKEPRAPRRREEEEEEEAPEPQPEAPEEEKEEATGLARGLSTGYCRLCHGKFSSRSLRNAFGRVPVTGENAEKQRRLEQVFFADFQRLVGVAARQDPSLPQFVCRKCHAQFYRCHSILKAFIQKVNLSPAGHPKPRGQNSVAQPSTPAAEENTSSLDLITSSPQCLHRLVMWAHGHAENCRLLPSLQGVISSEYRGIVQAVWGCGDGHDYVMRTDSDCRAPQGDHASPARWELTKAASELVTGNGIDASSAGTRPQAQPSPVRAASGQLPADRGTNTLPASSPENPVLESHDLPSSLEVPGTPSQVESPRRPACPLNGSPGLPNEKLVLPEALDERVKDEFSDLSEGDSFSEGEGENGKRGSSPDDFFQIYTGKRKAESPGGKSEEPKVRKKPGPKPGWKKKIKFEREELPTIYKCPYQGCTAVYRGADGMKKHIKEHHEEVRERPCPHPGCNKVFMIDRYLQRHVKLIHTEVRNYICDECGHTFKQRKHLSVHQMRHSGAKPLQCEICGFQCRQRASLKYHMTKHKAEAELEFACDQCGKRFEKAHNLNVHMSMVHPLTQAQDKPKGAEAQHGTAPPPLPPPPLGSGVAPVMAAIAASPGTGDSRPVKVELCAQQREPT